MTEDNHIENYIDNQVDNRISLDQVRAYVEQAGIILKKLGPDYTRVAWLLEDTLGYLDEVLEAGGEDEGKEDSLDVITGAPQAA